MISLPQGQHAWLLLGLLPGIWLIARAMLVDLPTATAKLLTPALACVALTLFTHIAALATHSLYTGFAIAACALGIAGYLTLLSHLRTPANSREPNHPLPKSFWIVLILSAIFIARPIFAYNFYDEATVPGHEATPSEMLNASYPPAFLVAPTIELRYHYGFDLLVAITQLLLHIRVDQANDVVTLAAWLMLISALWAVGESLISPGAGLPTALIVPFAGGLTFFGQLAQRRTFWTGPFRIHGVPMLYPFSLNFFQKPWAVGLPVWCLAVVLIVSCAREKRRSGLMLAALAISICGLSLMEAVLFASLVVAAGISLLPEYARNRNPRVLEAGLTILLAAVIATQLHGFFAPNSAPTALRSGAFGTGIVWSINSGGIASGWAASIAWNVLSFCLLLPLGIYGLRRVQSHGIFTVTAVIAFLVFNLCRYQYTTDIIKFAALAAIPLSIGASATLYEGWQKFPKLRSLVVMRAGLLVLQGLMFVTAHWIGHGLEIRNAFHPYATLSYPIDPDDAAAISFLRRVVKPPDNIYCRRENDLALHYTMWGGLPIIWSQDWDTAFGLPQQIQDQRLALATASDRIAQLPELNRSQAATDFLESLSAQGVRWLVVHPADDWLLQPLNALCSTGTAQKTADFGKIQIFQFIQKTPRQ